MTDPVPETAPTTTEPVTGFSTVGAPFGAQFTGYGPGFAPGPGPMFVSGGPGLMASGFYGVPGGFPVQGPPQTVVMRAPPTVVGPPRDISRAVFHQPDFAQSHETQESAVLNSVHRVPVNCGPIEFTSRHQFDTAVPVTISKPVVVQGPAVFHREEAVIPLLNPAPPPPQLEGPVWEDRQMPVPVQVTNVERVVEPVLQRTHQPQVRPVPIPYNQVFNQAHIRQHVVQAPPIFEDVPQVEYIRNVEYVPERVEVPNYIEKEIPVPVDVQVPNYIPVPVMQQPQVTYVEQAPAPVLAVAPHFDHYDVAPVNYGLARSGLWASNLNTVAAVPHGGHVDVVSTGTRASLAPLATTTGYTGAWGNYGYAGAPWGWNGQRTGYYGTGFNSGFANGARASLGGSTLLTSAAPVYGAGYPGYGYGHRLYGSGFTGAR